MSSAETDIQFTDPAAVVIIVSLDKMFTEREPHETRLKLIRTPFDVPLCDGRSKALKALQEQPTELVYFYCHGGDRISRIAKAGQSTHPSHSQPCQIGVLPD